MILIGDNPLENESLYRCGECGRILDSGESCCTKAPYWPELEEKANREYLESKRKARDENKAT